MLHVTRPPTGFRTLLAVALALAAQVGVARAQAPAPPAAAAQPQPQPPPPQQPAEQPPADRLSTTEQQIMLGGKALRYKATAGHLLMKDEAGKAKATIFFVAYEALPAPEDPARRPVTFLFNGGPGAAAVWLHLGTGGPKRLKLDEAGTGLAPTPPNALVDNPHTWLDSTDLVFIDPVGTGYSRAVAGEDPQQFFGVENDVRWNSEFIRLYTTRNNRWASPKFLAGESYGTTRAAAMSEHLLDRCGIALNGVVLVSSVLDFGTISAGPGNDLPYILFLPTYTATALYHNKLEPELQADADKTLAEVERWALSEYAVALLQGSELPEEQHGETVQTLARYTGLPADVVEKANLRVGPGLFRSTLLGERKELVGRFDSRLVGPNPNPTSGRAELDPSFPAFFAAYGSAFSDYARRVLRYETDIPYEVLTDRVHPWNFGPGGSGYLNTADNLRSALQKNPAMRVLFASGYYDLATPYLGAKYTVDHLDLSPQLQQNVSETFYAGGHMMYHHQESLRQLDADVSAFIDRAVHHDAGPAQAAGQ